MKQHKKILNFLANLECYTLPSPIGLTEVFTLCYMLKVVKSQLFFFFQVCVFLQSLIRNKIIDVKVR